MKRFLEFQYITPISNYKFTKYYMLVVYNTNGLIINVNKINLKELGNATELTRAYDIKQSIDVSDYTDVLNIKLFEVSNGIIRLFFSGECNLSNLEMNNKEVIKLHSPSLINNEPRHSSYTMFDSEDNLLYEQFFNYDTSLINQECLVFVVLTNQLRLPQNKKFQLYAYKNSSIYDRYTHSIIKELKEGNIGSSENNYNEYINKYQIDVVKFENISSNKFRDLYSRQIKPEFRKLANDSYLNMVSCCDGRVSKITNGIDSTGYSLSDFDIKSKMYGFISRVMPQDYARITMPYEGYLTYVLNKKKTILLRFESNYFVPEEIKERDLESVVMGHEIGDVKVKPNFMKVQEKTKLIFYVILINYDRIKIKNTYEKSMRVWFDKGEDLGSFLSGGYAIVLCNRPINFSQDISFYDIEVFVKAKDFVGIIA